MHKFAKFVAVSSLIALCSGCSGNMPNLVNAEELCADWGVFKPRKGDRLTPESAAELLANNEARVVWGCKKLENEAA